EPDLAPRDRRRDEDEDDRPRRRYRDDEEDDRPRAKGRRPDLDEDDEDRPPPRRRRKRYDLDEHRGGLVLALGICAVIGQFTPVTGPMAWILGRNDLRAIREGRMDPEGESMTRVGMILGMVATILMVVAIFFFCGIIG